MKNIFLTIAAIIVGILSVSAQNTESVRNQLLLPEESNGSRAIVTEKGDAGILVNSLEQKNQKREINGYRVNIFSDNSQNARSKANAAIEKFRELFPDIPTYINYDNPYWKVTVGNCLTKEEATVLKGRISGVFDRALEVREKIPMNLFAQ